MREFGYTVPNIGTFISKILYQILYKFCKPSHTVSGKRFYPLDQRGFTKNIWFSGVRVIQNIKTRESMNHAFQAEMRFLMHEMHAFQLKCTDLMGLSWYPPVTNSKDTNTFEWNQLLCAFETSHTWAKINFSSALALSSSKVFLPRDQIIGTQSWTASISIRKSNVKYHTHLTLLNHVSY